MRTGWLLLLLLGSCSGQPRIAPGGIVSNNPCIDSVLSHIATPGQIAAISTYSHNPDSASAPTGWAMAIPAIGTSAEEVIAARPALLLTGNYASGGTNVALAKAKVKMVALGVPATVEEDAAQIRAIAKAIGRQDAGEALVARIDNALNQPSARSSGTMSAIIWQSGGFVAGKGTLQDELLARAGFANASDTYGLNQWDILPIETLIRKPPSVIFMPMSAKGDDARELALRRNVLRHLHGRTKIVRFPDTYLFCGGPTIIKAVALMRTARRRGAL
jgi:iron complex transport system substrate-binding protein